MNEDYLDDEELEEQEDLLFAPGSDEDDSDDSEDSSTTSESIDSKAYEGKLSQTEIELINAYNQIANSKEVETAGLIIIKSIPKHTSTATQTSILKQLFQKQGHNRLQNTKFTSKGTMTGRDINAVLRDDDDDGYNEEVTERIKDFLARFIDYLANRDLSRDSKVSKAKKQRYLPALLIYLFSSGAYGYIVNCPTMPPEYQELIDRAFKEINKTRYGLIEELAQEYEKAGRPKVAERVRADGTIWFSKEPKEIYGRKRYQDLELTLDDIELYRKYRSKYVNTTNSITQEVISEYIYVIQDQRKGIYQKLKDKTRAEAITDVKQELEKFAKNEGTEEERKLVKNILLF